MFYVSQRQQSPVLVSKIETLASAAPEIYGISETSQPIEHSIMNHLHLDLENVGADQRGNTYQSKFKPDVIIISIFHGYDLKMEIDLAVLRL